MIKINEKLLQNLTKHRNKQIEFIYFVKHYSHLMMKKRSSLWRTHTHTNKRNKCLFQIEVKNGTKAHSMPLKSLFSHISYKY